MKKIFVAVLLIVSLNGFSQIRYGIKVGANFANINQKFTLAGFEIATKIRLGYNIGAILEYELSEVISLQSGLQLTNKGYSLDLEDGLSTGQSADGYNRYSITYLEVPVNVAYKIRNFQIIAGPYIAFGISGKNKLDVKYTDTFNGFEVTIKEDKDIRFKGKLNKSDITSDNEYIKGLDYGLSFGIGYNVGPMMINAGYCLGLANLTPEVDGSIFNAKDFKMSNSVLNLSVSYFFGK